MAYNRILLPVDGSEHSMHAVAHGKSCWLRILST